ncbi:Uncharacterised protein [Mycobacteroides abscessus subsp. bolletii]|uniref:hypothetical protein n=1 Tax=Mycobacteroides abscessus TaxID=36809 RepID=UPI0009A8BDDB|nr:hypothetical protein [Mycobacteroides abscessus]SLF32724.1 Uncharacterised protein [Mycobacteroides abscessus subsp. bolletii]
MSSAYYYYVLISDEAGYCASNWDEGVAHIATWAADHRCSMEVKHQGRDYTVWWLRSGMDLVARASLERRYVDE